MIPDGLKAQLIRHEGLRLKPYKCSGGKNTVGIGHNYDDNPLPDVIAYQLDTYGCITEDMAYELLEADVAQAVTDCNRLYRDFDKFSERRQWALIDFVFNLGLFGARAFSRTNWFINKNDWNNAAKCMEQSLWFRQVGARAKEIISMIREG